MNSKTDRLIELLLIEDEKIDKMAIRRSLKEDRGSEYDITIVDTLSAGLMMLKKINFDVLMTDLGLPDSQGIETFLTLKKAAPKIPIVVLTGLADEETGIRAMQEGAQDYLIKGEMDTRLLSRVIKYAIERKKILEEKEGLILELRESLANIKTLKGLIPICPGCKKVRDDRGFWEQVEAYISEHSEAEFSHGLCPDCARRLYPEYFK
jgi:DNA-binding NarL/FixJ family response regulator